MALLIEVRREPGKVVVVLRPYPRWSTVVSFVAVAVTAAVLGLLPIPDSVPARLFRVAMLLLLAGSAYGAISSSAWYAFGREIVTATKETLTIEHYISSSRRKRTTYSAGGIANIRTVGRGQVMRRGRPVSAFASALAFDYAAQTIRFGAGLAGAEAESVVVALEGCMAGSALLNPRPVSGPPAIR